MSKRVHRAAAGLTAAGVMLMAAACSSSSSTTSVSATTAPASSSSPSTAATSASPSASGSGSATGGTTALGCDAAKGKSVGFSEPIADPNFQAIQTILTKDLGQYGVTVKSLNSNLNPGKQLSDITSLLQQNVSALIVNPVDPQATEGVLASVRKKNIPIIALDTLIGGPYFTTVHDDMEYAGTQGAIILKQLVGNGDVAEMDGPPFAEVLNWEKAAFEAEAKQIGLHVVDVKVNQQISPQVATQIADGWKAKYGSSLKGVWTFNDTSAEGVVSTEAGGFSPQIVSINGQPEALPLVKAGKINTTFGVPYDKTAQALAYATLASLCKQTVPSTIYVPTVKLNAQTIGSWEPIAQRVNNPFSVSLQDQGGKTYIKLGD